MKKQIESLILTILRNEHFHSETFIVDEQRIGVDVTKCSFDSRGECYLLRVNTNDPYYQKIEHYGSRLYIKRILTQWRNGERMLVLFNNENGLKTQPFLVKTY